MSPKTISYKRVEMDQTNKKWFEEYKKWEGTRLNYHEKLKRFLEYPSNVKPFNTLINDDIRAFRKVDEPGTPTSTHILSIIRHFKIFLVSEKNVKDDFLNNLSELYKETKRKESKEAGVALNLAQIGYIRKYNKDQGNIRPSQRPCRRR